MQLNNRDIANTGLVIKEYGKEDLRNTRQCSNFAENLNLKVNSSASQYPRINVHITYILEHRVKNILQRFNPSQFFDIYKNNQVRIQLPLILENCFVITNVKLTS
jgi:hypothetical protein